MCTITELNANVKELQELRRMKDELELVRETGLERVIPPASARCACRAR